jgi:hypothetical protein
VLVSTPRALIAHIASFQATDALALRRTLEDRPDGLSVWAHLARVRGERLQNGDLGADERTRSRREVAQVPTSLQSEGKLFSTDETTLPFLFRPLVFFPFLRFSPLALRHHSSGTVPIVILCHSNLRHSSLGLSCLSPRTSSPLSSLYLLQLLHDTEKLV